MAGRDRSGVATATLWGGSAIGAGGLILLSVALIPLPGAGFLQFPLAALLVLLGAVVLTLPIGSVVAGSRVGSVALVVFGAGGLLTELFALPVAAPPVLGPILGTALGWVLAVAGVVVAITVWRARVLGGFARWVFVLPAAAYLLSALMGTVWLGDLTLALAAWDVGLAAPISLLLTGIALTGFGRWSRVRHRARTIETA